MAASATLTDQICGLPFQPVSVLPSKICIIPGGIGPTMVPASVAGGAPSGPASDEFPVLPPLPLVPLSSTPPVLPPLPLVSPAEPPAPERLPPAPVDELDCAELPEVPTFPDAPDEPRLASWSLLEQLLKSANAPTKDQAFRRTLEPPCDGRGNAAAGNLAVSQHLTKSVLSGVRGPKLRHGDVRLNGHAVLPVGIPRPRALVGMRSHPSRAV